MLSILNHSLRIQRDLYLVSSSKIYAGRSIKGSHFPIRNWLSLFIVFSSSSLTTSGMSLKTLIMRSLLSTEIRFHICKCNIKERGLYRSFSVMLDCFWRNVVLIYLLSTKNDYFSSAPSLLVRPTASTYTDWNFLATFSRVF